MIDMKYQFLFFSMVANFKMWGQNDHFHVLRKPWLYDMVASIVVLPFKTPDKFVCVEVLRPSQSSGVMSSTVSLPNHKFTGQV